MQTEQSHSLSQLYQERNTGIEALEFCSIAAKKSSSFREFVLASPSSQPDETKNLFMNNWAPASLINRTEVSSLRWIYLERVIITILLVCSLFITVEFVKVFKELNAKFSLVKCALPHKATWRGPTLPMTTT